MTMEVEINHLEGAAADQIDKDQIIEFLTNNETICFKSQQRNEDDLTKQQKIDIAIDIYNKSKLNFLLRFGKYLTKPHLDFFHQFTENNEESTEIKIILKDFEKLPKTKKTNIKNRRYEALKEMIKEKSYFSEIEMMKRNPLLYDQLVGQYLTEEEREERDRIEITEESTLVKVLMEGIERDNAQVKRKQQQDDEDYRTEESDSDEAPTSSKQARPAQWGEFLNEPTAHKSNREKTIYINELEQKLLKEEFVSFMYQNFLDGNDEDFDYSKVDENDKYDNIETRDYDEEEKYFDAEEPQIVKNLEAEDSEDDLDIFMSALNQHPTVTQLSKDIQKL